MMNCFDDLHFFSSSMIDESVTVKSLIRLIFGPEKDKNLEKFRGSNRRNNGKTGFELCFVRDFVKLK